MANVVSSTRKFKTSRGSLILQKVDELEFKVVSVGNHGFMLYNFIKKDFYNI
jgi:hypothetical protein